MNGVKWQATKTALRRPPSDKSAFKEVYARLWRYLSTRNSPILAMRTRRNNLTHVLGTIPGKRVAGAAERSDDPDVPYFITSYGWSWHSAIDPEDFHAYIKQTKDDYAHVLRFGALVFELEHLVADWA